MIIDTHLHIPLREQGAEYNESEIEYWKNVSTIEIENKLKNVSEIIRQYNIERGIVYFLDNNWEKNKWFPINNIPENLILGIEIDVNTKPENIRLLKDRNIRFVKILPYERKIFREDFKKVLNLAYEVEKNNMILTICCSYGSQYLYETNGVELTAYLVNNGIKSPIIMAHGGMIKILDAFSLMREFDNLYMDLSFTIPFWNQSTVLQDYAFALKKLNYERIFYGSDYPYISIESSMSSFEEFFDEYKLSESGKEKIYYKNITDFLSNKI